MKLYIAICDDDSILCKETKREIIGMHPEYEVDLFFSGKELLENSLKYDVIFLDIEMPEQNGMVTAQKLREEKYTGYIIFLTGHYEYMAEAFKVQAFRFLMKPVTIDVLDEILMICEHEIFKNYKMVVDDYSKEILVNISDIVYIKSVKKSTILYLIDKQVKTKYTLKYWMEILPENEFCQVHKTFIVSLNHIRQVGMDEVILNGTDCCVPLSRRRHNIVKQRFHEYISQNARLI